MTVLCDNEIAALCNRDLTMTPMITPFVGTPMREVDGRKVLSYGLSSYGYDVRLSDDVKLFTNVNGTLVDPKRFNTEALVDAKICTDNDGAKFVVLPPNSYMLGVTIETFDIPRDIICVALGKSTLARSAALVNVTPIEPMFRGNVVIEISNGSSLPIKIYLGEGIAQFMFHRGAPCSVSYSDKKGKYNYQSGLQLPLA